MINYGEIWTDLAQDGALFVAIHHFLYVTPLINCGWQVISSYFDEFF